MRKQIALASILALMLVVAPAFAVEREVTVRVLQNGVPVAGARVLVAADEMDAVGTTDAEGKITVRTKSSRISVTAEKGSAKGTTSGTTSALTITLSEAGQ
jgi:hypothetical protein